MALYATYTGPGCTEGYLDVGVVLHIHLDADWSHRACGVLFLTFSDLVQAGVICGLHATRD